MTLDLSFLSIAAVTFLSSAFIRRVESELNRSFYATTQLAFLCTISAVALSTILMLRVTGKLLPGTYYFDMPAIYLLPLAMCLVLSILNLLYTSYIFMSDKVSAVIACVSDLGLC